MSLEELLALEVTSVSRAPMAISETASAIQVITSEDIHRSGATRLPEALRLANNLIVARKDSANWGISARGFNTELANKMLVMMDGRTIYTPLFSGVRWDVQDYLIEDLDRIEVVSGPGGTLWGANAVNGVINIISKPAADTQGWYLEGITGTQFDQVYSARYGGMVSPNVHYRVYGKFTDSDGGVFGDGSDAPDEWRQQQGGFRIDAVPGTDDLLTFQGDLYSGTTRFVSGGDADVSGGNLLGRWSRTLANGSDVTVQAYFDRTRLRQPVATSAFAGAGYFEDALDTYDFDFQHRIAPGRRHRLVWGLGYRWMDDQTKAAPGLGFDPPRWRHDQFSAFIQDEIALGEAVAVTVGTKLEHTAYTGDEIEPTVRFRWKLNRNHLLWSAVSRAVRTPSRIDRDVRQPSGPPVILEGGRDFQSETLVSYEIGYRAQLGSRLAASVSTYYNRYDRIRSLRVTPGTFIPLVFANDLEADTYGLELSSTYEITDNWRIVGGYNLLQEDVGVKPGGMDFNNALNETGDPENQASLRSSIDLPRGVQFDAHLRWVDSLTINNVGQPAIVPSYTELDVRLGWQVNANWEVALIGRNLLHAQHPEYGLPGPQRVEVARRVQLKAAVSF